MHERAELSLVIPLQRHETIVAVVEEVRSALAGLSHEIVLVNDGSSTPARRSATVWPRAIPRR